MKLPRLKASMLHGEGDVTIPAEFTELHPVLRLDLLQDWMFMLAQEQEKAMDELLEQARTARERLNS